MSSQLNQFSQPLIQSTQISQASGRINPTFLTRLAERANMNQRELIDIIQTPMYNDIQQLTNHLNNFFSNVIQPPLTPQETRDLIMLTSPASQTSTQRSNGFMDGISEGCIPCENLSVNITMKPGFNCYYFTVELTGALTFEDIDEQLRANFNWGELFPFREPEYIL